MSSTAIKITPTLRGKRIYLRGLHLIDAANFLAATEIAELRYMTGLKQHFSLQDIQAHIQRCMADSARYDFAICLNSTNEMIGELSILEINHLPAHAEFRIAMSRVKWTGQGYGSEAIELVKDFVFNQLKLQTLGLQVFGHNARGQRTYEKCGFQVIDVRKNAFEYGGKYSDEIMMQVKNPNL